MSSAYDDGCELRPGSREYRARDRAYQDTLRRLGGPRTPAGRRFVDGEARAFRETMRAHRAHFDPCCFRALARGRRRLAIRLAQRWIKIQVGALA